ncbi:MAG: NAD-binding protein [Thermoplasmata archaeon]|nr:MAG: NAD-binding protein [Thermoplasmata archaeon]
MGRLLRSEGHEVAFIERDLAMASEAKGIDALVVNGDVCDPNTLKDAGIENSSYFIGMVKDDSSNITSCSLANYHGCQTIARIKNPSLAREAVSRRYANIGVDFTLCPPLIAASQISRVFAFPSKVKEIRKRGLEVFHVVVEAGSSCCKGSLSNIGLPKGAKIASVFRGVEQILPADPLTLQAEDELCILLDSRAKIKDVETSLGLKIKPYGEVKDVFIAGATDMGLTLAHKLVESDISVVIMEISKDRTEKAAAQLPTASVIHSNPLGHGVLKKESIEQFDVMLAMGYSMERNILISVLAKHFGVPRSLALVDRIDLKESVEKTLVDDTVVPNLLLVKTIMNLLKGSDPLRKKSIWNEEIDFREIKVGIKMRGLGKAVKEFASVIDMFLIVAVAKGKETFVPHDDYVLTEGDRIFLLYHPSGAKTVNRWLVG